MRFKIYLILAIFAINCNLILSQNESSSNLKKSEINNLSIVLSESGEQDREELDYVDESYNNTKKSSIKNVKTTEKIQPFKINSEMLIDDNDKTPLSYIDSINNETNDAVENVLVPGIKPKSGKLGNYAYEDDDLYARQEQGYGFNDISGGYDWQNLNNRMAPSDPINFSPDNGYVLSPQRLEHIRKGFFYWYFDQDHKGGKGDYQHNIHASNPQVHKNFNFQLPFFGFRFNYTRVSLNGYLEFSDPPEHYTYPLVFPIKDWPKRSDPSFIGIFFSKCRIGKIYGTDFDQRHPGVYYRKEVDLMGRTDRFGVEVRERIKWDIREGVVGADTFIPKHAVIITWKNMSFAGGIDNSLFTTNSFQMVLATDEVYTYAIFNYATITWSAHTEAGGDTTGGEGGVPAFIGFNGGNGTQAYEYRPYSQASVLRDLTNRGWANGHPGRHIFRIDERIMLGSCNKDIDAANLPLVFAPESGNMLGGTVVNITGPCFDVNERVLCHFDTESVIGHIVDRNRAICVQPFLLAQGYIRFEISIGSERFKWKGEYFVETPATATEKISFETRDVHQKAPAEIKISWNKFNLTENLNSMVQISLWGYRESTIRPQLEYIDMIEASTLNNGYYTISPGNYRNRDNPKNRDMQFGFLHINLTNPTDFSGLKISPVLWSKPIPLAWYFGPQWERRHGRDWPRALCDNWLRADRFLVNFAAELSLCPCTIQQALNDKGRYMPDPECDKDSVPVCLHHKGAIHCVRNGQPSPQGSEQQCCYDRHGFLMMSYDQMWGSRPRRNHNMGKMPWNEANKVPTLSTWYHDVKPYYSCCFWQDEQAVGCETFRFERRPSQDCVAYQAPGVGGVFGDPHFVTFDGMQYTFNGMGEFVLARGDDGKEKFEVQGRFERIHPNVHGQVQATHLTSVAAKGNTSLIIEVRLRPPQAQWRYRLDVFADGRRIYFDRPSLKYQYFHGVTVYTPYRVLNQSEVIIMFSSGVGVEVVENAGFVTARVYTPWSYINKTAGLLGNWSFDMANDFTLPDGRVMGVNLNDFKAIHDDFGKQWMIGDRKITNVGTPLFTREFGRTSSHYSNSSFLPNFIRDPRDFIPVNRSYDITTAEELCGDTYQCRYDYGMSLDREMAHFTKNYLASIVNIQGQNADRVISCGVLETPRFGRKKSFGFTPGTSVAFECNEGFVLTGDSRRVCTAQGYWDTPVAGYTECLREVFYTRRTAWIAIGIILAVIAPIMLCIVCGVYCYRKRALREDPNYKMTLPRSRSASRQNLRNLNASPGPNDDISETDQDTLKKRDSFEGVYRTNEPLRNRPNSEFPEKKWDLEDDDFTSSETGSAGNPKQTGRRSLRSQNDVIAEEELAGPYEPPPQQQQQQQPPQQLNLLQQPFNQYSPTFSGAERSSGESSNNGGLPRYGAVKVFPGPGTATGDAFYSRTAPTPPISPVSAVPLRQDIGLPSVQNNRSTEV